MQAEVLRMLRLLDASINHVATGWLHKADVKTALAGFFKAKKASVWGGTQDEKRQPGACQRASLLRSLTGRQVGRTRVRLLPLER